MSDVRDRRREALLDELRRLHRAEPAPAGLRERLLEQAERGAGAFGSARRGDVMRRARRGLARLGAAWSGVALGAAWPGVALGALAAAVLTLGLRTGWSGGPAAVLTGVHADTPVALGPEPRGPSARAGSLESSQAAGEPSARRTAVSALANEAAVEAIDGQGPCPLDEVPRGAVIMPRKFGAPGVAVHTFDQQTVTCGALTRRYLERLPAGLPARSGAPVVIVLHDAGESAEAMHTRRGRLDFERIAEEKRVIVIYANAAPGRATRVGVANSGAWQTDSRTHFQVDDIDYLRGILGDLELRHVIDGRNDVYLAGYGDGAAMALDAAVRAPGYVGVAAFEPPNQAYAFPDMRAGSRLSRVMLLYRMPARASAIDWRASMSMIARRWGAGLGLEQRAIYRSWSFGDPKMPVGSLEQVDVALPATGSSAVRVYMLEGSVEPEPSALHAWDFLTGAEAADVPDLPELPSEASPSEADAVSDFAIDDDEIGYHGSPSMVLQPDVVRAARPGASDRR